MTVVVVNWGSWIVPLIVAAPPPRPLPPTAAGTWIVLKPSMAVKNGESVIRTYRRSAETTGVTMSVTPLGNGADVREEGHRAGRRRSG